MLDEANLSARDARGSRRVRPVDDAAAAVVCRLAELVCDRALPADVCA